MVGIDENENEKVTAEWLTTLQVLKGYILTRSGSADSSTRLLTAIAKSKDAEATTVSLETLAAMSPKELKDRCLSLRASSELLQFLTMLAFNQDKVAEEDYALIQEYAQALGLGDDSLSRLRVAVEQEQKQAALLANARSNILELVKKHTAELIGVEPGSLNCRARLADQGMDSIRATTLANRLTKDLERELPQPLLYRAVTIDSIVEHL